MSHIQPPEAQGGHSDTDLPLPIISVIMIFLNEEKFIREAIESVRAQTFENWELILVDDGSTDRSTRIARAYADEYPDKVCYLEHADQQNRGMSASRNLGIRSARGKYITFLDADDIWLPEKLAEQVSILESKPGIAFVIAPARYWYSWTGDLEDIQRDFTQNFEGIPINSQIKPPLLLNLCLQNEWATACDLVVRREVVEAVKGYEDNFKGMFEDQAFHAKLSLNYPGLIFSKAGILYRQHPESCTSQSFATGRYYPERLKFLNWLDAYISKKKVKDRHLRRILHREAFPLRHPKLGRLIYPYKLFGIRVVNKAVMLARALIPSPKRDWLLIRLTGLRQRPPVGLVRFGNLRRMTPIGPVWPNQRGLPVDRYYIEGFLQYYSGDVKGHVLELGDASYTERFGGDRVTRSDVLHGMEGNPAATIVADLTQADHLPSDTFDCVILTQTLLLIYDLKAALRTLYRILRPGGVLLATVPGITMIIREDMEECGQYWSFTSLSVRRLFAEFFPPEHLNVEVYGNVLAATAFLYGLSTRDLRLSELDHRHPDFEVIIGVRAQKPEATL